MILKDLGFFKGFLNQKKPIKTTFFRYTICCVNIYHETLKNVDFIGKLLKFKINQKGA